MESAAPDTAEEAFVELAKRAWRGANAKQKRALRKAILDAMQMVGSGDSQ